MQELSNLKERVYETTASTGTGNITLIGAKTGYQTFNGAYGIGVRFPYLIEDLVTGDWESGITTLSDATTLVRNGSQTVVASSNSGAAVSFTSGVKNILSAANTRHVSQFAQFHRGNRLAFIGTSMSQLNSVGVFNGRHYWSSRGPISWLRAYLGDGVDVDIWFDDTVYEGWEPSGVPGSTRYFQGKNFGVSGQNQPSITARLAFIDEHYIDEFDCIIIESGTNDAGGTDGATLASNNQFIAEFFLARGKTVFLSSILARGTVSWADASTPRKRWNKANRLMKEYCRGRRNLFWFDWNEEWCDKTNANGVPVSTQGDGIHWDPKSAERVARWMVTYFQNFFPPRCPRVVSQDDVRDASHNDYGNLLPNPFLQGTSGTAGTGATGTVATSMQVERNSSSAGSDCSVACSVEARADGAGNWQVCTFTMAGSSEEQYDFRTSTVNTSHFNTDGWLIGSCEVETNNSDEIYGITLTIDDQGTDGQIAHDLYPYDNSGKMNWLAIDRKIQLKTPPFKTVSDSTQVRWRVEMHVKNSGSVPPVIKIGAVELRKIDDPRPASLYA